MLKQIKHISILTIATFYMFQLTPLFSNFFIENIQDIRNKIQSSKLHLAETRELSISFWNTLGKKKEFKIDGIYYDVISYKRSGDKIITKVVKDSYEENFKIALDNLFDEDVDKNHQSDKNKKKRQKFNLQITTISSPYEDYDLAITKFLNHSNYRKLNGKTQKIVITTLRPPC